MKNFRKHIDDFFREKLGKYTETPPPEAWDELSVKLDTLKPYVPGSSTRWFWHAGMVGMIAVLSFTVTKKIINKSNEKEAQERLAENISKATTSQTQTLNIQTEPGTLEGRQLPANANVQGQSPIVDGTETAANNTDAATTTNNNEQPNGGNTVSGNTNNTIAATHGGAVNNASAQTQGVAANTTALNTVHGSKQNNKGGNSVGSKKQRAAITRSMREAENIFGSGNSAAVVKRGESKKATTAAGETLQENVIAAQVAVTNKNNAEQKETIPTAAPKTPAKVNPIAAKKAENETAKKQRHCFEHFGIGIKAGYERGMSDAAASKYVVAPYIQYNVSPKVSILTQPAVKYATLKTQTIGDAKSYYKVNNDGKTTHVKDVVKIEGGSAVYTTTYNYSQTHDSIVKTNTTGGTYYEVDVPLLLQYKVSSKIAVYGGVNGTYGKKMGIAEQTYEKKGIVKSVDHNVTGINAIPEPKALNDMITYSGTSVSEYTGPKYSSTETTSLRLGYMLGLSYEYSNRWMLDAMIQQSPLKPDVKEGYNINIPLSSAYFRLSVGYKIKK